MKRFFVLVVYISTQACSADYTPDTTGWWQLQDSETYEEICSANSETCNPEPGEYTLIDFGTSPALQQSVTIGDPVSPVTFTPEIVTAFNSCLDDGSKLITSCVAECPVGKTAIGIAECSATEIGISYAVTAPDGSLIEIHNPIYGIPMYFYLNETSAFCRYANIIEEPRYNSIDVAVKCF